ncbi:MAG: radical SAM protein [Dehalococcoidia bacterium]|nr:radical SAM protein [Dehalococcoidia bacterium]
MQTSVFRRYAEELKFIRSITDFRIMYDKIKYDYSVTRRSFDRTGIAPLTLQIEPTNFCNSRCTTCPTSRMKRQKGYMDFTLFTRIADEAAKTGIKRVQLYLHGEPLLHPRIVDMVSCLKSRQMYISLVTNGMLLDEATSSAILNTSMTSGDYVTISILGASREVHEQIMKGVVHETVAQNISTLLRLRREYRKNGPIVQTVFYECDDNAHELKAYLSRWQGVVDHATVGATSRGFAQYKGGSGMLPVRDKVCTSVFNRMVIHWNGQTTICPMDVDGDFVVGDLRCESFRDVWDSTEMLDIRAKSRQRRFQDISLCRNCDFFY